MSERIKKFVHKQQKGGNYVAVNKSSDWNFLVKALKMTKSENSVIWVDKHMIGAKRIPRA